MTSLNVVVCRRSYARNALVSISAAIVGAIVVLLPPLRLGTNVLRFLDRPQPFIFNPSPPTSTYPDTQRCTGDSSIHLLDTPVTVDMNLKLFF